MLYDKKWDKPAEVELEPWRKHLLDAAQYIRDHGWCQGAKYMIDGRVCAVGAIAMVVGNKHTESTDQVIRALRNEIDHLPIPFWNDLPGRTQEQVIAAFEQAARRGE